MLVISGVRCLTAGRVSCWSIGGAVSLFDAELDPEDAAWLPAEIPNDPAAGVGREGQQEIPELDHAPLETMLRWRKVVALHRHHWRSARNGVVAVGDAEHIAAEVLQRVAQEIPIELPAPLRPLRGIPERRRDRLLVVVLEPPDRVQLLQERLERSSVIRLYFSHLKPQDREGARPRNSVVGTR